MKAALRFLLPVVAMIPPALGALEDFDLSVPKTQWHEATPTDKEFKKDIAKPVYDRLMAGRFDELDGEARRLAAEPTTLRDGTTRLEAFYIPFSQRRWTKNPDWEGFKRQVDAWVAKSPESDAANLAAAVFYVDYAWLARGTGFANTVTDDMESKFEQRLEIVRGYLAKVKAPEFRQGDYWGEFMALNMGLGGDKDEVLPVVEKALAGDSDFRGGLTASVCIYLLPRWHGEKGEWQSWLAAHTGGAGGDIAYAEAALSLYHYVGNSDGEFFGPSGLDYERAKNGFLALAAKYPESSGIKCRLLDLAMAGGDKDTARAVMKEMKGAYEPGVLSTDKRAQIDTWLAE